MSLEGIWPTVKMNSRFEARLKKKKKTLHVNLETRHKYVDVSWLSLSLTIRLTSDSPELLNSDQVSLNSPLTSLINFSGSRYWFEKQRLNRLLAHVRPDRIQIWAEEPQPVEMNINIHCWDIQKNTLSSHIKQILRRVYVSVHYRLPSPSASNTFPWINKQSTCCAAAHNVF